MGRYFSISLYPDPVLQREGPSVSCKPSSPFSAWVFPFPLPRASCRFCCLTVSHFFSHNQLLVPHFRYTMEINMLARNNLVSEWGIFDLVWKEISEGGGVSQGYLPGPFFPPNSASLPEGCPSLASHWSQPPSSLFPGLPNSGLSSGGEHREWRPRGHSPESHSLSDLPLLLPSG